MIVSSSPILVTGASGFLGRRVVARLLECQTGPIRALVRHTGSGAEFRQNIGSLDTKGALEIVTGDLLSVADCRRAADGAGVILHLAAGIDKSFAGAYMNSALATRNLIEAYLDVGQPGRFVNVSSFSVYSNLSLPRGALLDESCPLEDDCQARFDAYGFGKLKQDEVVREYGLKRGLQWVIVRPGSIFGPGKKNLTGRVGIDTFGVFLHTGGSNRIPLTYVDNCADAIVLAGSAPGIEGETFNVVDDDLPTSRAFLRGYRRRTGRFLAIPVPYYAAYAACALWEGFSRRSKGQLPPAFNRRRCAAEWKGNRYTNAKLKEKLGWMPRVPMQVAMESFLAQFDASS